ncbi:MAG: type II secretion system F family protein [Patescibacteria group bacterium]
MAKFLFKAKNDKGANVTGSVEAANEFAAEKMLLSNKLFPSEIIAERKQLNFNNLFVSKATLKDKAVFARQLATMIGAGLTLSKALSIVAKQARNEQLKAAYYEIFKDIEEGYAFSTALAKHPNVFDRIFVSVARSGETTGNLEVVLSQLADKYENDNNFVGKIKSALYYPIFILVALLGIGVYMLVAVIPKLDVIFKANGVTLPVATRVLIALSGFFTNMWWLALIILILLVLGIRFWLVSDVGARTLNIWQLKIPGIKGLSEGIYMSRFSRTLEMLISSGVPILDSLKIAGATMNNQIYEESIAQMALEVEKGVPLSVPLSKDVSFPGLMGQMVAVGEQTGKLDKVLDKVATYYESETSEKIKGISTLVEPAVLLVIGFGVAFLIFAILVPIYNIAQIQ